MKMITITETAEEADTIRKVWEAYDNARKDGKGFAEEAGWVNGDILYTLNGSNDMLFGKAAIVICADRKDGTYDVYDFTTGKCHIGIEGDPAGVANAIDMPF